MAEKRLIGFVCTSGRYVPQAALKESEVASRRIVDQFDGAYAQNDLVQPTYSTTVLLGFLDISVVHAKCCDVKARDVAGHGWKLVPLTDTPSMAERERVETLFDSQNPGIEETIYRTVFDREALGYGAIEIVRHDGVPVILSHLPGHTLRVARDGRAVQQRRGNRVAWFKFAGVVGDLNWRTGKMHAQGSLSPDSLATEVLWFANYWPRNERYGAPSVVPASGAILGDLARTEYNLAFFKNFGVPAYAIYISGDFDPGDVGPDGMTTLERNIEAQFRNLATAPHSSIIIGIPSRSGESVKVEFQPLAVDVKEASFRLYRKDNRDEILLAHGVPAYRVGLSETGSLGGTTARESTVIYRQSVIAPLQKMVEATINKHILWDGLGVTGWRWQLHAIDTADEKHDIEILGRIFDMGAVTPNQVATLYRDKFGIEPDPRNAAMNAHYIKGVPIDGGEK